jgi:hypothetical protein
MGTRTGTLLLSTLLDLPLPEPLRMDNKLLPFPSPPLLKTALLTALLLLTGLAVL